MTSCREFLELMLEGWLLHELPRRRQRDCDEHVATCQRCANYVDSYRATVSALADLRPGGPPDEVPEDLVQAILGRQR